MARTIFAIALSAVIALTVATAHGDDIGEVGTPVALQVNTLSADTYLQFHGRVFLKNADGGLDELRWGGLSCGSRVLTEGQIESLQRAVDTKNMRVIPLTQDGQGQAVCVVGFTVLPKASLKLALP